MDESEQPPPHAGKHLTREDVERLIEEHGGPEGLDLSHADLRGADLGALELQGANLSGASLDGAHLWLGRLQAANLSHSALQGADLSQASLQRSSLRGANLQGSDLTEAQLQGADLCWADLRGATLWHANLEESDLAAADLQRADLRWANLRRASLAHARLRDTNLEGVNWGDYVLAEETASQFTRADSAYRALKQWHTQAGMYDIAGKFHYREMEARHKLAWEERRLPYALSMLLLRFLYGYGERPERVIGWAAAVVFGLAFVYLLPGVLTGGLLDALYYSAVSFTALGYGHWAPDPQGWAGRFLGAGESFLGVFMMALFLVTFTRKMTR